MGLMANEARAGVISMSIDLGGGPVSIDGFATVQTANVYGLDIVGLNAALAAAGSAYQFASLGGDSNQGLPSNATEADLNMHGGLFHQDGVGGSNFFLKLFITQDGWAAPTGSGTLASSSTGNFNNQTAGGGHEATSEYNPAVPGPVAGPYSVLSTTTDPNPQGGMASVAVSPVVALFTLQNTITFALTPNGTLTVSDGFSVETKLTAAAVPEPASVVMMVTALPLPLLFMGMLRRRSAVKKG
jgi:hypothetical protein